MAFGIDDAVAAVFGVGNKLIDRLWPDPIQRERAQFELLKLQQEGELAKLAVDNGLAQGQLAVNKAEAENANIFVSGWRPFIGWTCGAALAYQFVGAPLAVWIAEIAQHPISKPPSLDDTLWQLVFSMLGLGGLRTFEKIKGVSK